MHTKIAKKTVDDAAPGEKDLFWWDSELPGFGLKVTPRGKKIYICQYRIAGRVRRMTLGRHGPVTAEQARLRAKAILGEVAAGGDPAEGTAAERASITVKDLADRYLSEHAEVKKKPLSLREDKRLLQAIVIHAIGKRKVCDVNRSDIAKLHHDRRDTPYQANRSLSLLSKIFNLAEKWGLRPDGSNPCRHIERYKEQKRRRFLNIEELARLGSALAKAEAENSEPPMAIAAIRLLIFTGARLSEILTLKWEYVKWDIAALLLPDSKTGFKTIQLSAPARQLLEAIPTVDGNPYVIMGKIQGQRFVGLQSVWERIRNEAALPDVRLHDLRHGFASVGAAAGLGLPIIGALLGHSDMATTQRYAHLAADPLKAAAELIAGRLDEALKAESRIKTIYTMRKS